MRKERFGVRLETNGVQNWSAKAVVAQNFDAVCVSLMSDSPVSEAEQSGSCLMCLFISFYSS